MSPAIVADDVAVARRARRRITLRPLPYVFLLYVIAYLDRTNLATAALQMPHDLGFDDRVIGFGAGIFSLGYVILEIPGTIIVERWSAFSLVRIPRREQPGLPPAVYGAHQLKAVANHSTPTPIREDRGFCCPRCYPHVLQVDVRVGHRMER